MSIIDSCYERACKDGKGEMQHCSCCHEDFQDSDDFECTPCGHVFHHACLDTWINGGNYTCPFCREIILPASRNPRRYKCNNYDNHQNPTNIWQAVEKGYYWIVAAILRRDGRKAMERNANGETPLLVAASHGQTEIVQLLISEMTNLNINIGDAGMYKYRNGQSPLHRAAARGSANDVRDLLVYFPVNTRSAVKGRGDPLDGATPLHHAAANGNMETVRVLLARGANPDHPTETGWIALGLAIDSKHWDIARLLYSQTSDTRRYDDGFVGPGSDLCALEDQFWHPSLSAPGCKWKTQAEGKKWVKSFPCSDGGKLRAEEFFAESGNPNCHHLAKASDMLALYHEKCERSKRSANRKRSREAPIDI